MAIGWAKEGDGELEAENEIAEGIQNARDELAKSQGSVEQTWCIVCGDFIDEGRRLAIPNVQRCTQCQSKLERNSR